MREAVRIIKNEHASMAAVLHGLRHIMQETVNTETRPDFRVLHAMLDYIVAFPDRLHHPKEERYLFRLLRERSPGAEPVLAELEAEHAQEGRLIQHLKETLIHYEASGPLRAAAFQQAVNEYAEFVWDHMRREEELVLPLAEKVLTEADWRVITQAFQDNDDPLFGVKPKQELETLFQRVVNITPAPLGVGPATLR